MPRAIPVVWSDAHRLHDPRAEIWVGVRTPAVEVAARADAIRAELEAAGHPVVAARAAARRRRCSPVHDRALLDFLARRVGRLGGGRAARRSRPGPSRALHLPHPGLLGPHAPRRPSRPGRGPAMFAFDTMTLIGPGTWEAARGAADAALTAADLVLAGAPAAYACCRPPGHHVTRSAYGGSCYLNNAAIAAARLRDALGGPVALLDVDAHHGNGAQAIFYDERRRRSPARSTSTPARAGSRTSSASPTSRRRGGTNRNVRSRPAAATRPGSPRCRSSPAGRAGPRRARWWSRSASTPPPATRRARSR